METKIDYKEEPDLISAFNMPLGSIGRVIPSAEPLYLIHTIENGDSYIALWPNSNGIEVKQSDHTLSSWKVKLLPKGTKLTLTF